MFNTVIVKVEWAGLPGARPREAGSNSRLDVHGLGTVARLLRITTADGQTGLGWSDCPRSFGGSLLGKSLSDVFVEGVGPADQWQPMEYPLWDLAARIAGKPVFRLLADQRGVSLPEDVSVPCYDTSLYIDDLHLSDDRRGRGTAEVGGGLRQGPGPCKLQDQGGPRRPPHAAGGGHRPGHQDHQGRARGGRSGRPHHDRCQQRLEPEPGQAGSERDRGCPRPLD